MEPARLAEAREAMAHALDTEAAEAALPPRPARTGAEH
jgi:hypothetical protein